MKFLLDGESSASPSSTWDLWPPSKKNTWVLVSDKECFRGVKSRLFSKFTALAITPGRFPVHERSTSAPGSSWSRNILENNTGHIRPPQVMAKQAVPMSSKNDIFNNKDTQQKKVETNMRPPRRTAGTKESLQEHKKQMSNATLTDRGSPENDAGFPSKMTVKHPPPLAELVAVLFPPGYSVGSATRAFSADEINLLRAKAKDQTREFAVLRPSDMEKLSQVRNHRLSFRLLCYQGMQELRILHQRYEYLQHTYKSLLSGRQSLRERVINYLKSPSLSIPRENILKQEEALAEFDISIGEWACKVEEVMDRRALVQQKLLQHVAAAIQLQKSGLVSATGSVP